MNPFEIISQFLENGRQLSSKDVYRIEYEFKTLGNIIYNQCKELITSVKKETEDAAGYSIEDRINSFLADIKQIKMRLSGIEQTIKNNPAYSSIKDQYINADDYISFRIVRSLLILSTIIADQGRGQSFSRLVSAADNETVYRKNKGYITVAGPDNHALNERYLKRTGRLKKWSQSALYLNQSSAKTGHRLGQIIAGTAAGLAMSFALLATILTERFLPAQGAVWGILLVLVYILKDRVKDIMKSVLKKLLPGLIAQDDQILTDSASRKRFGKIRTWVGFTAPSGADMLPFKGVFPFFKNESLPVEEQADKIEINREYRIKSNYIRATHKRHTWLTEINRLDLENWLTHMDSPHKELFYIKEHNVESVTAKRVYSVGLEVCFSLKPDMPPFKTERFILQLTKNGIDRIDKIE